MAATRGGNGWVLAAALVVAACTGTIGSLPEQGDPAGGPGGPGSPTDPLGSGGASGESLVGTDPGSKSLHRLNQLEYNATVQDVLGTALAPATDLWRGGESHGFDNIAAVLGIDDLQYERYFEAARTVAADVFASEATRGRIVTCTQADDAGCVGGIVEATGRRLFRRPLTADEVTTYRGVYDRARRVGESHEGSLEQVVRALLSSVEFLYRIEVDSDPGSTSPRPVGPHELASRLSYFLWSSAPDDPLLASAGDGSIAEPAVLADTVERMLDDPRSERFLRSFVGQWLGARRVGEHAVTAELFPEWSPTLAQAMADEMYQYAAEFLRTDRSWLEFLTADVNFVTDELARFYGMASPGGTARVEERGDERVGFLGLGGFLALSSYEYRTAPTLRGRWILINLLCSPPADPPPGVPTLDDMPGSVESSEQNVRARLEQHRTEEVCNGCHSVMDPYGIALENFDAVGKFRETYRDGSPIDTATELPDGTTFDDVAGVAAAVTAQPKFTRCVAEKLFTYALGRGAEATDRPYIAGIDAEWRSDVPHLRRLIHALVTSEPFRMRRGAAAP